ncbi:MAG: YeiH family protein [Gaiella sp.]
MPIRGARLAAARLAPGLALAAAVGLIALAAQRWHAEIPAYVLAVASGVLIAALGAVPAVLRPGLARATSTGLRIGVVLLGFDLVFPDVLGLGGRALLVVVAVVALTFVGTRWIARLLGVGDGLGTLTAVGFSICGVSAIAAARDVVDADEDDVAFAVALVTLCGTLAIVVLPALRGPLGLEGEAFGAWVGASVHDVGQVVATASVDGDAALATAIVVKLTRVLMLAPLVALLALRAARSAPAGSRLQAVPPFVAGFVLAIAIASTGVLSDGAIAAIDHVRSFLFAAALFAIGTRVDLRRLARLGLRPVAVGLASWALIALIAYVGVELVWV